MELHREIFTISGEPFGERLFRPLVKGNGPYAKLVLSSLLYCGFCGDQWGRRTIIPASGYRTEFFAHRYTCEKCGDGRMLSAGGGEPDLHNRYLVDFPRPILQRELAMYARMFQDPATEYWNTGFPNATNPYLQSQEQQA